MRDFTIKEAAAQAALQFPDLPPATISHICEQMISTIVSIVEKKKGRIRLQKADIHTIYYDITPSKQRAALADLNEAEILTEEQEQQSIIERLNAKQNLSGKNKRLYSRFKRIHNPGPGAHDTYPK